MKRRLTLLSLLILVGSTPLAIPSDSATKGVQRSREEIVAVWSSRTRKCERLIVKFHLIPNSDGLLSRYQSEWVSPVEGGATAADEREWCIWLDALQVRADGPAWSYDDHELGILPFNDVLYPCERLNQVVAKRFDRALSSRFELRELEYRKPHSFSSICDAKRRYNIWRAAPGLFPRAAILTSGARSPITSVYGDAWCQGAVELDSLVYQAVLIAFRPFHPFFGALTPDDCWLSDKDVLIGGRRCMALHHDVKDGGQHGTQLFFVDPCRDYIVVRYIGEAGTCPSVQIDIDYRKDPDFGWCPNRWTVLRMEAPNQAPKQFATFGVDSTTFNQPIDQELFHVAIPAGAWVVDLRNQTQYLVRADGSERRILNTEFRAGAEYAALLETETGFLSDHHKRISGALQPVVIYAFVSGGLIALISASLWSRGRLRATSRSRQKWITVFVTANPLLRFLHLAGTAGSEGRVASWTEAAPEDGPATAQDPSA